MKFDNILMPMKINKVNKHKNLFSLSFCDNSVYYTTALRKKSKHTTDTSEKKYTLNIYFQ